MSSIKRILGAAALTVGIVLSGGAVHAAQSWGPLTVYNENGQIAGTASNGSAYYAESSGSRYYFRSTLTDKRDNSYGVYQRVNWAFNGSYCYPTGEGGAGCTSGWYGAGNTETSATWSSATVTLNKELSLTANSIRGQVRICERQSASPDPCSGGILRGMSY